MVLVKETRNDDDDNNLDIWVQLAGSVAVIVVYIYLLNTIKLDSSHPLSESFALLTEYYH